MTVPHAFYTLLDELHVDPDSERTYQLAQQLAARSTRLAHALGETTLPVGLFPDERHESLTPHLERLRRHVQPFGLDLRIVPAVCIRGVLVYLHLQPTSTTGGSAWTL